MTRDELIARLRGLFQSAPPQVVAVYLYGSWARAQQRGGSDVDLAFWRDVPSEPSLDAQPFTIAAKLEAEIGLEVDLIELNRAPPDLVHEVMRDGMILLDRDPASRVRREMRARAEYLDMLPVLQQYRRARTAS